MGEAPKKTSLGVVFVQHDRTKYPGALTRLIRALDGLDQIETHYFIVDNALPGTWRHDLNERISHLGGDNSAWEFSAFDLGVQAHEAQAVPPDLYLFSTDALLAYGERFLGLVDDRIFDLALEQQACVGWMDSFMDQCQILDYTYTTWIRTSLLLMPRSVLPVAMPMAWPLDDDVLFGPVASQPFRSDAPLSRNLTLFLTEWLTTNPDDSQRLDEVWHSQFHLSDETFPLFKNKVKSILREHLLSARLLRARIPCFDLRSVRAARTEEGGARVLRGAEAQGWQWLRWLDPELADASPIEETQSQVDTTAAPTFVLYYPRHATSSARVVELLARDVLPLVRQRHARARLLIAGSVPEDLDRRQPDQVATLTPNDEARDPGELGIIGLLTVGEDQPAESHEFDQYLIAQGVPLVASGLSVQEDTVLMAAKAPLEPWALAGACCRVADAFFDRTPLSARAANR